MSKIDEFKYSTLLTWRVKLGRIEMYASGNKMGRV